MPYREPPPGELFCPRCKKKLPPIDVATCACGTWVTAFVADVVLTERDRRPDPMTRWWRVLEPCPMCKDTMRLHGEEPGLLLGCAGHGFWIDADTIVHTGLARPVDQAAIERKRDDAAALTAERESRERAEQQRAQDKAVRERAEAVVRQLRTVSGGVTSYQPLRSVIVERAEVEPEFLPVDPIVRALWLRLAALEQRNAELELRVARLEE